MISGNYRRKAPQRPHSNMRLLPDPPEHGVTQIIFSNPEHRIRTLPVGRNVDLLLCSVTAVGMISLNTMDAQMPNAPPVTTARGPTVAVLIPYVMRRMFAEVEADVYVLVDGKGSLAGLVVNFSVSKQFVFNKQLEPRSASVE